MDRYRGLELVAGVVVVRMGGPLFFADANRFRDALNEMINSNREPVRALVVDATAISQTDTDGADIVIQIAEDLRSRGIALAFAHLERSILELWTRAGAIDAVGPDHVFETVRAAVQALDATPRRDRRDRRDDLSSMMRGDPMWTMPASRVVPIVRRNRAGRTERR